MADFLDVIVEKYQLDSRMEARRLIIELRDHDYRLNGTVSEKGYRRRAARTSRGKILDVDGTILPKEERTVTTGGFQAPPEAHIPPANPFDPISLSMRANPVKPKVSKNTTIHRIPTPRSTVTRKSTREYPKRPAPGSKAEIIAKVLKKNNWDHRKTRDEMLNHPIFDDYAVGKPASKKKQTVLAAVMVTKNRWKGRV